MSDDNLPGESEPEKEFTPASITDLSAGPFLFFVLDGKDSNNKKKILELELDDWTIDAEKWAKKHYGSMQTLFNTLLHIDCDDDKTVDAAIDVANFKLTEESRRQVEERRGELTTEDYLRKNLNYKMLAALCRAEYEMIKESIPFDALKKSQEILTAMQTKNSTTTAKT